jgi:CopG family transcriptional regulator/antitoxin EndoAI
LANGIRCMIFAPVGYICDLSGAYICFCIKLLPQRHNGNTVCMFLGVRVTVSNAQNTKRIMISLPDYLLQEVDGIVEKENSNRSEFIRQAMKLYLMERKKRSLRESMQRGYMEMAKINLHMASEAFMAEEEADLTLDRLVSGV